MAYQSKKHRKFVATTVTAALVATAVAPAAGFAASYTDVKANDWAKAAIDYVSEKGIMEGPGDGKFNPTADITRGEVAAMLVRALGLEVDEDAKTTFPDVAEGKWYYGAVATLQAEAPDLLKGNEKGQFMPEGKIDRQSMARLIADAFGIKASGTPVNFTDVPTGHWAKAAVDALSSNGVVNGKGAGKFDLTGLVTRAEAAQFFFKADTLEASVVSVSAINTTTLKLNGHNLAGLKAEDIEVSNNTVVSAVPAQDGKSVTVTLNAQLVDGEEVVVKYGEKEFKFTFKVDVKTVTIKAGTYDDNTAGQYVKVVVDGQDLTGADLIAAGYDVTFEAFTDKAGLNAVNAGFFDNDNLGLLSDDIPTDATLTIPTSGLTIYVAATVSKGSDVYTTGLSPITIRNLDLATEKIESKDVRLGTNTHAMTKDILAVGESATVSRVKVKVDNVSEWVSTGIAATSSNPGVIAVDNTGANPVLTAITPGTATITINYGNTSQTYTYKVENGVREVTSVQIVGGGTASANPISSKNLAIDAAGDTSANNTVYVKVFDRFGDLVDPTDGGINVVSSNTDAVTVTGITDANTNYVGELVLTPVAKGSAFITFTYTDPVSSNTYKLNSNAFRAQVFDNATPSSYKLEIDGANTESDDFTLNLADTDDDLLSLKLVPYTSQGIALAPIDLTGTGITVNVVQTADVVTATATANGVDIEVASKTGTASVTVTYNGKTYTQKVTVVNEPTRISGVQWKSNPAVSYAKTYTYEDVFQVTKSGNDDILKGVTVTPASSQPVRIDSSSVVYLDKNANGVNDAGDVPLGEFEFDFIELNGTLSSDGVTSVATTSGDEGTLVYKIVNSTTGAVIASSSVKIDVN